MNAYKTEHKVKFSENKLLEFHMLYSRLTNQKHSCSNFNDLSWGIVVFYTLSLVEETR